MGETINYVEEDEDGNSDVESALPIDWKHERETPPRMEVAAKKRERKGRMKKV
jgi:hypothetical protein